MFVLQANKNRLTVKQREMVTSGSVNVYTAKLEFSSDWDGLSRIVVFRAGSESRSALLDYCGKASIPWEVLQKPNVELFVGVYGTQGGEVVLPTVWASLGTILEGTTTGKDAQPPAPDLWKQELDRKGDGLAYDGLNLSLMSGDKKLSSVEIVGGGDEGGVVYEFGHGLKQDGLKVSVDMASKSNPDKTLPISAAAVETTVGNIDLLLQTI